METQDMNGTTAPQAPKAGWGRRLAIGGVAALAVGAVGIAGAVSQGFGAPSGMGRFGGGMGFGEHRVSRILEEVDATPEQEQKIWAIIDGTRSEVRPAIRGFRDAREQVADILGGATIDRAAIEKLRAERIAALDETSKKVTAALVGAAEVLTPEQRGKLAETFRNGAPDRR